MIVIMQLLLCGIAAIVAYGLYKRRVMWRWIVAYWVVLTVKNLVDCFAAVRGV